MEHKIIKILTIIAILSLLPIFMGQDKCKLSESFKHEFENKIKRGKNPSNTIQLNIAFYSMVSIHDKTETIFTDNINYLIASSIQHFVSDYNDFRVNFQLKEKQGAWKTVLEFNVKDSQDSTKKIMDILASPKLVKNEKIKKVIDKFMYNDSTDILITGRYYDNLTGDNIIIEIMALFKTSRNIEIKKLDFPKKMLLKSSIHFRTLRLLEKDELAKKFLAKGLRDGDFDTEHRIIWETVKTVYSYFTYAYENDNKSAHHSDNGIKVTHNARIKIEDPENSKEWVINPGILEMLENIKKKLPPPDQSKLYITHLSFMDAVTRSTMPNIEMMWLIDKAVIKGMIEAQKINSKLEINEGGHFIPNTDENVNKLINTVFDPNLTKNEKINKMITILMNPNHVDVIVTGHYVEEAQNPRILIRPLIIIKYNQKVITKNLQFTRNELVCIDQVTKEEVLCRGAHDQIVQAVRELLEEL